MATIKGKKGIGKRRKSMDKKRVYFALENGSRRRISRAEFDRRELLNLPVTMSLVAVSLAATTGALGIIAGP